MIDYIKEKFEDFERMYKDIKIGINNVIYWFPVIWKDRWWDQAFLLEIIKHKLKDQSYFFKNYSHMMRADREAELMEVCATLCDRVAHDYYDLEHMDYFKSKMWFDDIGDGMYEWKSEEVYENYDDYFEKYPRLYKNVSTKSKDLTKGEIAREMSMINQQRAKDLLFKIMNERIQYWWD